MALFGEEHKLKKEKKSKPEESEAEAGTEYISRPRLQPFGHRLEESQNQIEPTMFLEQICS